jgi:hypothetical protein
VHRVAYSRSAVICTPLQHLRTAHLGSHIGLALLPHKNLQYTWKTGTWTWQQVPSDSASSLMGKWPAEWVRHTLPDGMTVEAEAVICVPGILLLSWRLAHISSNVAQQQQHET